MTSAPPRVYDPRLGHWVFDTCSLRNFEPSGLLGDLALKFQGRARLVDEVIDELPANSPCLSFPWYQRQSVVLPEHAQLYRALRGHWRSAFGADRGEAACITMAFANGWGFITDDGTAFSTATNNMACLATMRTTALILAMVRAAWVSADQAWAGYQAMISAKREKLGPIPWADRTGFDALCKVAGFDPRPKCDEQ